MLGVPLPPGPGGTFAPAGAVPDSVTAPATIRPARALRLTQRVDNLRPSCRLSSTVRLTLRSSARHSVRLRGVSTARLPIGSRPDDGRFRGGRPRLIEGVCHPDPPPAPDHLSRREAVLYRAAWGEPESTLWRRSDGFFARLERLKRHLAPPAVAELRLRVNVLEAQNGIPTGLQRGSGSARSCVCAARGIRCGGSTSSRTNRESPPRPRSSRRALAAMFGESSERPNERARGGISRAPAGFGPTSTINAAPGRLAQLVRAPALQAGGRAFEPRTAHHPKQPANRHLPHVAPRSPSPFDRRNRAHYVPTRRLG